MEETHHYLPHRREEGAREVLLLLVVEMGDKRYRVGGTRGGQDQFKWEDVKGDVHRENYLGHSLLAPVGRWQRGENPGATNCTRIPEPLWPSPTRVPPTDPEGCPIPQPVIPVSCDRWCFQVGAAVSDMLLMCDEFSMLEVAYYIDSLFPRRQPMRDAFLYKKDV